MSEPFWIADPSVLFRQDTWLAFVPTPSMTVDQSLNAVVRFVTYLSALLFLCSMDFRYILYIPVTMLVTVALHKWFPVAKEMFQGSPFVSSYVGTAKTQPTVDNPFMNPTLVDINENPNKPPPTDITSREARDKVNASFAQTSNLYMDTSDVYANMQSQINFHSVPIDDHAGLLKSRSNPLPLRPASVSCACLPCAAAYRSLPSNPVSSRCRAPSSATQGARGRVRSQGDTSWSESC